MVYPDHLSEARSINVGVDFSGGYVAVTEHLLHGAEVGSARKQVRGEGVSQRVRVNGG